MATTVYCFINATWGEDVAAVAVCGTCGALIGSHVSSSEQWAEHDMLRPFHRVEYQRHALDAHGDAHGDAEVEATWVAKPAEHAALSALLAARQHTKDTQDTLEESEGI